MDFEDSILLILGVAVVAIAVGYVFSAAARRRKAFQQVADELHMSYTAFPVNRKKKRFALMQRGCMQRLFNLLRGTHEGLDVEVFDYRYDDDVDYDSMSHVQSVILFRQSSGRLPRFELLPQRFAQRIGELAGYETLSPEDSSPNVKKHYLLHADDTEFVRAMFDEAVFSALAEHDWQLCIEAHQDAVIVYRYGHALNPEEISRRLEEAYDIAALLWRRVQEERNISRGRHDRHST